MKKKMIPGILALGIATVMVGSSVMAEPARNQSSDAIIELISDGDVMIDDVPDFNFGIQNISATTEIYPDISETPYVQITDLRGSGAGWHLSIEATAFKADGDKQLKGAILRIKEIKVGGSDGNISDPPTTMEKVIEFGEGEDDGVEQVILNAVENAGSGEWLGNFYDESKNFVELEVPAGNKIGEYTSTLTWTLTEAPK